MGKPKSHSRRARKLAKQKGIPLVDPGKKSETLKKFSVDEVLQKAEEFIEEYNYDMAQKFVERALEIDADNPEALEMAASLLLEAGQADKAKQCLGRAITVAPDTGHAKYFSMAQLFEGQESLDLYQQGIKVLSNSLTGQKEEDAIKELASAHCAIAELFMTDLCDKDDAEAECAKNIKEAIEADSSHPESWQTKARLHLIKSEFQEARGALNKSLSLWLPTYLAVLENRPEEAADKFDPVEVCPLLYTTRLSTARMLIELEDWDQAIQVLDGLTEEDDSVVDPWYLLGWLNRLRADIENDKVYDGKARFYLEKARAVNKANPTSDEQMVSHIEELLSELGPEPEGDEQGDGDDDNWEDLDDMDES